MHEFLVKHKKGLIILVIAKLLFWVFVIWLGWQHKEACKHYAEIMRTWTMDTMSGLNPVLFTLLFGVLPLVLFPISILYIAAGAYGVWEGIFIVWAGLAINIALGYWIARGFLRTWIEKFAERMKYSIPKVEGGGAVKLTLVVRVVPGLPFGMQNYVLGLAGVPFRVYYPISLGIQGILGTVMVRAGGSALHGNYSMAITFICVLVLLSVIISVFRKRYVPVDAEDKAGA